MILGLILSSVSLVLNMSKYKNNIKWRDGMLVDLGKLKNMTSRYLDTLGWTTKDLRGRVSRLEKYNRNLIQEIVYLTKDDTFPELKSHPVKTIRIQQKEAEDSFQVLSHTLSLEIPAEDASVLFSSPKLPAMPNTTTFIISTQISAIRKNQIPWQEIFRIKPRVMKIPFTDWALVFSRGLEKKRRFCADVFLMLALVLPDPISPIDIVIDKSRKEETISMGEAPDHVEISIQIPYQIRLSRVSEVFLDAILKIYPDIERRYPSNAERLSNLPFGRYFQPARDDQEERAGGSLVTNIKIELETYKQAIRKLRPEVELNQHIPCFAHVRLEGIDRSGNALFTLGK